MNLKKLTQIKRHTDFDKLKKSIIENGVTIFHKDFIFRLSVEIQNNKPEYIVFVESKTVEPIVRGFKDEYDAVMYVILMCGFEK